ncbi:MAG: hypothetical protein ACOCRX_02140 [Candidatus Woesearchaeota archaeon]
MLDKDIIYKAISNVEYRRPEGSLEEILLKDDVRGEDIVGELNIKKDSKEYYEAVSFCNDYINLVEKENQKLSLLHKLEKKNHLDASRILKNTMLYGTTGFLTGVDPMMGIGAAGLGFGMTMYDENKDHSAIDMFNPATFSLIGAAIGSIFSDVESGKYIGAGIGAVYGSLKEIFNSKKYERRFSSNDEIEDKMEELYINYEKKKKNLVELYS